NGDGKPDLAVANRGNGTVSVLLGNGDGTFQAQLTFAVGSVPEFVAAADLNRDGKAHLPVANLADGTVSVLLGNGDGPFQAPQAFAVGAGPPSLVAADVNGDGKFDLVVTDFGSNDVSVLENLTVSGATVTTFAAAVTAATG